VWRVVLLCQKCANFDIINSVEIFSSIYHYFPGFVLTVVLPETFRWLFFTSVLWFPVIAFALAWGLWVRYVRYEWIRKQEKVLLEIKLPQETTKSPLAMELVLLALYQTSGEGTPIDRYWEGKVRPWFSLELVSIDGEIHFYIWTFKSQRAIIESNIYAQYPGVEIHLADDYTTKTFYDADKYELAGCRFEATGPDPLPIKTYVDYGLDKDPKEEFKVDPLAPLIEFMGSIKKGHQAWVQIVVRAHTQEKTPFNEKYPDKWKDEAKELIQKIIEESAIEDEEGNKMPNSVKLTEGQKDRIKAIERSVSKFAFDAGIRILYLAPKDVFDKGVGGGLTGSFKQFNAPHLNGFKPEEGMNFDYKWQDWKGKKLAERKKGHYRAYCERGYFHYPFKRKWTVLNTEELATIYHFPGSAVMTPTLKRIPSKRADAPSNLPI
jgi:hypothetical protein